MTGSTHDAGSIPAAFMTSAEDRERREGMKDIIEKINGWNLEDQFDIAERDEIVERLTCYKEGARRFIVENGYYWVKLNHNSAWKIHEIKNGFVVSDYVLQKYETDQFYEIGDKIDVPVKYRAIIQQQVQPDNSPKMCEECGQYPADLAAKE